MQSPAPSSQSLLLSLAAVLVAVVALILSMTGDSNAAVAPAGGVPAVADRDLLAQLGAIEERLERIESGDRAADPAARVETAASRRAEIEAIVAAILAERGAPSAGDVVAATPDVNVDAAVAELTAGNLWSGESEVLWQRIRDAGKMDEVVAAFVQRAAENPNSAEALAELGHAYVQQIMDTPNDIQKGVVAMQAEKAYDTALELDPTHWDARFSQAVGYTFWPDFLGKKAQAIEHLNTLVEQQESRAAQPQYAQTYVILGNLYEQRGDAEKAREIWGRGAAIHPEDNDLKERTRR